MRCREQAEREQRDAEYAGGEGEDHALQAPLGDFPQGEGKAEGGRRKGEVPLHEFKHGKVCRFLHHMELHRNPDDDEHRDKEREALVGERGVDMFVMGTDAGADEHDKEHEQEACGHEGVAHGLHIVRPVPGLVAVAEGRVEHLPRVADAEQGRKPQARRAGCSRGR